VAGFTSVGADVLLLGPVPTPAVAMLTRSMRCDLGGMISASHNPYEDNGIKLFGPDGYKLSDEVEARIEALMDGDVAPKLANSPQPWTRQAHRRCRRPLYRIRQADAQPRRVARGPPNRRRLRQWRGLQGCARS